LVYGSKNTKLKLSQSYSKGVFTRSQRTASLTEYRPNKSALTYHAIQEKITQSTGRRHQSSTGNQTGPPDGSRKQ